MPQPSPTALRAPEQPVADPLAGWDPTAPGPVPARVKRLRLALILAGLSIIAFISTVFGMMMAVASDLPALENQAEFRAARNSVLLADNRGNPQIARLTGNQNRILLGESEISPNVRNAVIAMEDRRFYEHEGVDYRGIARALVQDLRRQEAVQGGSTITQQFVKNALLAHGDRSIFQKLRESALAYHLEREWSKQKVITQYLNTVYFGNGAYGVEAAVRTYFGGDRRFGPGERAASSAAPHEAALLAGLIASPTAYDPVQNPKASRERRDLVLRRMLEQGMIGQADYDDAIKRAIPSADEVNTPTPDSAEPYFSTWVTQQLVDRYGSGRVFGGGLRIKTTLDAELQQRAKQAIDGRLGPGGPSASLVAIENRTGEVKALIGGDDFERRPFNLATNGHRQPGSAFKPFILVEALRQGISPNQTFTSRPKLLAVRGPIRNFAVRNYEASYSGVISLAGATIRSDNSVYAELGLKLGTRRIARLANRMGIRTRLSTNPAMTLGGLREGLTPLEMAHAYSTIANRGLRTSGTMSSSPDGPVAIDEVRDGNRTDRNKRRQQRVFSRSVGEQARRLLQGVVLSGTGTKAQVGEFAAGKTGTTENHGDAWFVGFTEDLTVAVWVGYPDRLKSMTTEYNGGPVAGGTFPAEIWHDFMAAAIQVRNARSSPDSDGPAPAVPQGGGTTPQTPVPQAPTTPVQPAPTQPTPAPQTQAPQRAPVQPAPQSTPAAPPRRRPSPPAGGRTPTPGSSPSGGATRPRNGGGGAR